MNWYLKAFKQYADFKGRARRQEYWMFSLLNMIFTTILIILDNILGFAIEGVGLGPLYGIYALVVIIPSLAVSVRRLHDIEKSSWMILIPLIPLIGTIWLLVLLFTNGSPEANKYGKNPKESTEDSLLEDLVLIHVVWTFLTTAFFQLMPKFNEFFFESLTYRIGSTSTSLIWSILPISFVFAVKSKTNKIILFILGGIIFLYNFYELVSSVMQLYFK